MVWSIGLLHQICQRLIIRATPLFLYKWLKIPFGLTKVPSCFQRYINKCIAGLQDIICVKYLDDVLIHGRTFEKHVKNAEKFLQQLRESGIKLNPAKCNFFKREVIYLGQPISKDGYHQDPQNNDTLEKFTTPPKIIGKLWFLLGFLGYYCAYIKNFFRIMKSLYDILVTPKSKNGSIDSKWSIIREGFHQNVLDKVINCLKFPEIIWNRHFTHPFIIQCDASQKGLEAVLYQKINGKIKIISFASRTLSPFKKQSPTFWETGISGI